MLWVMLIFITIGIAMIFVLLQRVSIRILKRWEFRLKQETSFRLQDIFLFIDPAALWSGNIAIALIVALAVWMSTGLWWLALLSGILLFMLPDWLVARIRRRRMAQFDRQLPEMLLALAGALRAGAGIQTAVRQLSAEAPPPLSQEFGLVQRQQRLGVPFVHSLDHLYSRMPTESTGLFVSALKIATHSGGNLAEALERIAQTLQSRQQIQGRIRALTSQGKMQAWVMAGLPPLLMTVLNFLDPAAMRLMWFHPVGWIVLTVIFLLELLGVWLIRRIVNIYI